MKTFIAFCSPVSSITTALKDKNRFNVAQASGLDVHQIDWLLLYHQHFSLPTKGSTESLGSSTVGSATPSSPPSQLSGYSPTPRLLSSNLMQLSKPCASAVSHLSVLAPLASSAWKCIPLFAPFITQNRAFSYHLYGDVFRDTKVSPSLYGSLNTLDIPHNFLSLQPCMRLTLLPLKLPTSLGMPRGTDTYLSILYYLTSNPKALRRCLLKWT